MDTRWSDESGRGGVGGTADYSGGGDNDVLPAGVFFGLERNGLEKFSGMGGSAAPVYVPDDCGRWVDDVEAQ